MPKLLLATRNEHKLSEIRSMLRGYPFEVLSYRDFPDWPEVDEDQPSIEGNAIKKAVSGAVHSGLVTVSDDTGLEVDALGGRPGVYSSRFAGENATYADNNTKLLGLLEGVPLERRTARFRCVVAIAAPLSVICRIDSDMEVRVDEQSGEKIGVKTVEGVCNGLIGFSYSGNAGLGYDPLFVVPELGKTFAELDMEVKNRLSHRGLAFEKAKAFLISMLPFWED